LLISPSPRTGAAARGRYSNAGAMLCARGHPAAMNQRAPRCLRFERWSAVALSMLRGDA
jgi:hypothetical protein